MHTSRWLLAAAASTLLSQAAVAQTAPQTDPAAASMSQPAPMSNATGAMSAPAGGAFTPITPAPGADLVGVLTASGQFSTLLKAVEATGLTPVLKGAGPLTVFAPTDAAFAALPPGTLDTMMQPDNLPKLQALLTYHVINAKLPAIKGHAQTMIQTVAAGKKVTVDGSTDNVKVNDAAVLQGNVQASNGVIFVVDKVLSPDFVPPPAPTAAADDAAAPAATTTTKSTTTKTTRRKR